MRRPARIDGRGCAELAATALLAGLLLAATSGQSVRQVAFAVGSFWLGYLGLVLGDRLRSSDRQPAPRFASDVLGALGVLVMAGSIGWALLWAAIYMGFESFGA